MRPKSETSNSRLLVHLIWLGYFLFFEIKERMKQSVHMIHPIGHDRSRQNKSMRDEELISRKAEHLTIVK